MRSLSPVEAVSPAFTRTRAVLLQPFRLGRSWKLAFCAYLALCGSLFLPFPIVPLLFPKLLEAPAPFRLLLGGIGIAFTALMFGFYYLGSRMQFVLFDFVLAPSLIAPLWRRHGGRTWQWIRLKLAITLPIAIAVLLPIYPTFKRLILLLPLIQKPPAPPDPRLLGVIVSLYAVLTAAMCFLFLIASILSDFVLPSLALEEISSIHALRRLQVLFLAEPLTLIGYLAMRTLLALLGFTLQYAAALVVILVVGLIVGAVAFLGWLGLHGTVDQSILFICGVLLYIVFICCVFYVQLATFGVLIIYLRAYSLFFLAGRYPLLGNLLEPPLPSPPPPPPLQLG